MTTLGYAAAASHYWEAGWHGILHIPHAQKTPPPPGYTGHNGKDPSYPDVMTWSEDHPDDGVALRMPATIIGIDVDDYGTKSGNDTLAHAEQQWGALPATIMSTSRDNGSGIRYYQIPDGTKLKDRITFPHEGLGGIEVIQRHHRYAMVWPSIHRDTGHTYRWVDATGNSCSIPKPDDLPQLPSAWLRALAAPCIEVPTGPILAVEASDGMPDIVVADRLETALGDLADASSRHDTTRDHVLALLRYAEQGRPGVSYALQRLGAGFVAAVTADGTRTAGQAGAEFARMVRGERGHALIAATPTPVLDIDAISPAEISRTISDTRRKTQEAQEEDDQHLRLEEIDAMLPDEQFWNSSQPLTAIYETALARRCAPWSVLAACLARTVCTIAPEVTLPPIIGGAMSLNLFVALVGRSGDGKSASADVAEHLIPLPPDVLTLPVGSGEGLSHAYVHRATSRQDKERADAHGMVRDRASALLYIDEIDSLAAIAARSGATLMPKLRSAYVGQEIGAWNADPLRRIVVGKHKYRMGLIAGVQEARAGALLDDADGGTPQRFIWARVTDPAIGRVPGREHLPLMLPDPGEWAGCARSLTVPDAARDEIVGARLRRARGDGDALDGHALLAREKVMVALAVLDGRAELTETDWVLAGKVMAHSDRVRAETALALDRARMDAAERRGYELGATRVAAEESEAVVRDERRAAVAAKIVEMLAEGGEMPTGDLRSKLSKQQRGQFQSALSGLAGQGAVELVEIEPTARGGRPGVLVRLIH